MAGWLKLHRSIIESTQFANPIDLKIWVWLLCKAAICEKLVTLKVGRGHTSVRLQRGQVLFGRHKAEELLCIDGSTIYKVLQRMEIDKCISIQSNNQYSIITIKNYNDFQSVESDEFEIIDEVVTTKEQPKNNQVTAAEQPSNSGVTQYKNDNNQGELKKTKENDEKGASGLFPDVPPPPPPAAAAAKERKKIIPAQKKEITFPFPGEQFAGMWVNWKEYKSKEFKFKYKSEQSEQAGLNELVKLSGGIEVTAIAIIMQSMAKGWKGFFQLKTDFNNGNGSNNNGQQQSGRYDDYKAQLAAEMGIDPGNNHNNGV